MNDNELSEMTIISLKTELNKILCNYMAVYDEYYSKCTRDSAFLKDLVDSLLRDKTVSLEDKIIKVYEFICMNYIYDVNVLYLCKKC